MLQHSGLNNAVTKLYQARIDKGELEPNEFQYEMAARYDALLTKLISSPKTNFLTRLFSQQLAEPIKGFYIYGKVGRGKTMLMDLFFSALPFKQKMRAHFNDFMLKIQSRINYFRKEIVAGRSKSDDAIELVASEIAQQAKILCFDEFSVTDIADAMILARLFKKLFTHGVVLVATSNVAPKDLYHNGLNRDLFLPFIPILEANCEIINTAIAKDFRLDKHKINNIYLYPNNPANEQLFIELWQQDKTNPKAACYEFKSLCKEPKAAKQYIELVQKYNIIYLKNIESFNDETINIAKRFILLIDVCYEHNTRLIALSECAIDSLYQGKADRPEKFEFTRTASRLFEMQSKEYFIKWQDKYASNSH